MLHSMLYLPWTDNACVIKLNLVVMSFKVTVYHMYILTIYIVNGEQQSK